MLKRIRFSCYLKVSSADEAALVNTPDGADLGTLAAARAKGIINSCQIVFNLDSAVSAGLFAFHASDTAVGAALSCDCALVVIGAFDNYTGSVVYKLDNALRTGADTDTAADTLAWVDASNGINDCNSLLGASVSAISVTETR